MKFLANAGNFFSNFHYDIFTFCNAWPCNKKKIIFIIFLFAEKGREIIFHETKITNLKMRCCYEDA